MKKWISVVTFTLSAAFPTHAAVQPVTSARIQSELSLTPAENAFLASRDTLKVCVDPAWMPYEQINSAGQHEGISADYMALMAQRLAIGIELYRTETWYESLQSVRHRSCDLLPMARETEERKAYLNFTAPYIRFPFVVATHDELFIEDISSVLDRTFVAIKGFAVVDILRKTFPDIRIIEVDSIYDGLEPVRNKQAFGYFDSMLSIGYAIQQQGLLDIKISGKLEYASSPSVATRNDQPLLNSIFQKALDSISPREKDEIYNRWVSVRYDKGFDYVLFTKVVSVILLVLAVFIYWNRKLAAANSIARNALSELSDAKRQLEEKNQQLALQNRQLEHFAATDFLTGLFNRGKLDELLQQEIARSNRYQTPFGIVLLDIDLFKQVNDTYGHQVGDQTLTEISNLLLNHSRDVDRVGRWGGEEFMIISPEADASRLQAFAEKLRAIIANHHFPTVETKTASFGITLYQPGDSIESLTRRADAALYAAKEQGRNRVEALYSCSCTETH